MNQRNTFILIAIILIIGGAAYGLRQIQQEEENLEIFPESEENITPFSQETADYISNNISRLSPEEPVLGGKWYVMRLSFVDEEHLYVEYEDGHIARRLLLEKRNGDWQVLGFFSPGKDMWELVSGENPYLGAHLTIYERNQAGEWQAIH